MLPNCLTKAFASTARLNNGHLRFCGFIVSLYKALLVQGFTGWRRDFELLCLRQTIAPLFKG